MALDIFLKIDTINGGATQKGFEHYIDVDSFSWGESVEFDPISGSRGQTQVGGLVVVSPGSKATPKLAVAGVLGTSFKSTTLTVMGPDKAGKSVKRMFIKLTDSIVTSFSFAGSEVGNTTHDRCVLGFRQASIASYDSFGNITETIDLRQLG